MFRGEKLGTTKSVAGTSSRAKLIALFVFPPPRIAASFLSQKGLALAPGPGELVHRQLSRVTVSTMSDPYVFFQLGKLL